MKKVLIVANLLHASPRIPGLAKYLPEFGWQPIMLTTPIGENPESYFGPPNDFKNNFRTIEIGELSTQNEPDRNILAKMSQRFGIRPTKALSLLTHLYRYSYKAIVDYPDRGKGWKPSAVKAGSDLLQSENIEAMISSSPPVTSHLIAKELKVKQGIPWVADLRDLWSQNHYYSYGPIRKFFDRRLELKTFLLADALVTVSAPLAERLSQLHNGKPTYSITNGFDPDKLSHGQANLISKFTITYTGQIYRGKQDPLKLFAALRDLVSKGTMNPEEVEIRFYGTRNELIAREIEEHELSAMAKQYGIVPRETSFEKQRESQLLLLLNWEDRRERGGYTLKIFEYLAAQRPILVTGGSGDDVVKELLDETKAGIYCQTVEDVRRTLRELYAEYKSRGKISYSGNIEKINRYSYREMARKFAEILNRLTAE